MFKPKQVSTWSIVKAQVIEGYNKANSSPLLLLFVHHFMHYSSIVRCIIGGGMRGRRALS